MNLPSPWPEGCQGAISLTFDDGIPSQLRVALPMLEDAGLRATYYLCPGGDSWPERLAPWRELAQRGHEIGNHSLSHTCSRNFSDDPSYGGLEAMTLETIEADVLEAERRLREVIPECAQRSYCYPCYQAFVGHGAARRSYVPVIARHFVAARGLGESANSPANCDLHYLWSWDVNRLNGAALVGLAERACAGRWVILTFHGIHQGHLSVADVDFRELIAFLSRNRERLWVAPMVDVAKRVAEWRAQSEIGP